MLVRLTISNFALIDELTVNFEQGLNIITGETGAGKSIILGALSLILGARADISSIRDVSKKCVVEGAFRLDSLSLESFFTENDLDFDKTTILRREITPSGKTRSFINDTPVNLQQLRELTLRLVDIHSQHQNLELNNQVFQLQVVDVAAQSQALLLDYKRCYTEFNTLSAKLDALRETASKAKADLDYHEFQFNQLTEANLQHGEEEEMEEERQKLSHAEEIKSALAHVADLLDGDKFPVLLQVKDALGRLDKIRHFMKEADEFHQRLESVYIELQDIAHETASLAENTEFNPQRLEQIAGRLDLIYSLQQKHQLSTVTQLIELRDSLSVKISMVADYEEEIAGLEKILAQSRASMNEAARKLSLKRKGVFHEMEKKVVDVLQIGRAHV